jgi:hypothetical protein
MMSRSVIGSLKRWLALLGFTSHLLRILVETVYEPCQDETIATTYNITPRLCIRTVDVLEDIGNNVTQDFSNATNTTEYCGECLEGYILWDQSCIDGITWQDYVDAFQPNLSEVPSKQIHLDLVKVIATLISNHNSQIPPPDFFLIVNHLSSHSKSEIKK